MDEHDFTLGVDLACSAAHVATLADTTGRLVWSNHRFRTATSSCSGLGEGARRGATAAGDRADPKRLGAVGGLVQARGATVILLPRRYVAKTERRMTTTTHGYRALWPHVDQQL